MKLEKCNRCISSQSHHRVRQYLTKDMIKPKKSICPFPRQLVYTHVVHNVDFSGIWQQQWLIQWLKALRRGFFSVACGFQLEQSIIHQCHFFFQNSPSLLFYGQIVEGEFLKMVLLWKLVLLLPDKVSNKRIVWYVCFVG